MVYTATIIEVEWE